MNLLLKPLFIDVCKTHNLHFFKSETVAGGDINQAFKLITNQGDFFLKVNSSPTYPQMFDKESEGLTHLAKSTGMKVPAVIGCGIVGDRQYLLQEFLIPGQISNRFWILFGEGQAQLHGKTNDAFGWFTSNYIGSLKQQNNFMNLWDEFYGRQRIMPLVVTLFNKGVLDNKEVTLAENVCKKLGSIFPNEPPALLHGDLWSGNFMAASIINADGKTATVPAIFDPAVYYGHREMDLGMTLLFGSFDQFFYEAYHASYPLEKEWRLRVTLTQLYPLLVHAVLFGGSYINRCRQIFQRWN